MIILAWFLSSMPFGSLSHVTDASNLPGNLKNVQKILKSVDWIHCEKVSQTITIDGSRDERSFKKCFHQMWGTLFSAEAVFQDCQTQRFATVPLSTLLSSILSSDIPINWYCCVSFIFLLTKQKFKNRDQCNIEINLFYSF